MKDIYVPEGTLQFAVNEIRSKVVMKWIRNIKNNYMQFYAYTVGYY